MELNESSNCSSRKTEKKVKSKSADSNHALVAWQKARQQLDKALHSCHFWWASAYPWWSIEMIEAGARELLRVVELLPDSPSKTRAMNKAQEYYKNIIFTGFEWMRSGKVDDLSRWHS